MASRDGRREVADGAGNLRAAARLAPGVIIRDVLPAEYAELGDLRLAAYHAGGFLADASHYVDVLPVLGIDGTGQIMVAVAGGGPGPGQLLGTVMLLLWPQAGQVARGADEAEVRALAVAPQARGHGLGRVLIQAVTDRAAAHGVRHLVLSTQPGMAAARHRYEEAGFRRLPDRDWCPVPGFTLLAYGRVLSG
jgi:GNAT superfamily N-acetyltransferase